jgi:hypothetical protein
VRHQSLPLGIFAIACGLLTHATAAHATATETWVSGTGTNSGACTITAPCRTFAFAHNLTAAGGTIHVLTSGSFGPLTITKTISIVADGVDAMIETAAGGAAIIVQVAGTGVVSLHGLTIDERGTANDGISFVSGGALHVDNCTIRRARLGINFAPTGTSKFYISDSVITDSSGDGFFVHPTGGGAAKIMADRVRVENAGATGFDFNGTNTTGLIQGTVRDSVAAGNGGNGILAIDQDGNGLTKVMIDHTSVVNNINLGVFSVGESTIWIGDSTVTGNGTGLSSSGGILASYGTNKLIGNVSDGAPQSSVGMR